MGLILQTGNVSSNVVFSELKRSCGMDHHYRMQLRSLDVRKLSAMLQKCI